MKPLEFASIRLSFREQLSLCCSIVKLNAREHLIRDSFLFKRLIALVGLAVGCLLLTCRRKRQGLSLLASIHSGDYSEWVTKLIALFFRSAKRATDAKMTQSTAY